MSVPYSYVSLGIPIALALNLVVLVLTTMSVDLYLACKDLIPEKPESFYEIGY